MIVTIMHIYHTLINALSARMIYINLNMIFYITCRTIVLQNGLHKVIK